MSNKAQKKLGRPRKGEGPRLPYDEVDRLLVEGEEVVGDDGRSTRRFPSYRELGQRFGVAHSLIALYAKRHDCLGRRQRLLAAAAMEREAAPQRSEVLEPRPPEPYPAPAEPRLAQARSPLPSAKPSPREAESTLPKASSAARSPRAAPAPALPPATPHRPPGRPHKADAPLIPYEQLDKLLVFGEIISLPDGSTTTVYPSYRQLAERYGVSPSLISSYARSHNCRRRREEAQARIAARADQKLVELRATALAVSRDDTLRMIDGYLLKFEKALAEDRVRFDNPTDFNTMVRLKAFVEGGADSRREVTAALSLESLQARHARMMRQLRETTPAEEGLVDLRRYSSPAREEWEDGLAPGRPRALKGHSAPWEHVVPPSPSPADATAEIVLPASGPAESEEKR